MRIHWRNVACACALLLVGGCGPSASVSRTTPPPTADSTVFVSVTSDPQADPQAVDMAMKLAGFSLDEGRQVVMFFNVKGVTVPSDRLADDFAFQQNDPLKSQVAELIERGVDVHVCPICMKALDVSEQDLIDGAAVTTRPSLFSNINANTSVFTY